MIACCSTILIGWIGNHRGFQAQQHIGIFERIHKVRMRGVCFTVMWDLRHIIGNWTYCDINRIGFRPLIGRGGIGKRILTTIMRIRRIGNRTVGIDHCYTMLRCICAAIDGCIDTCCIGIGIKGIAIRRTMTKTTIIR